MRAYAITGSLFFSACLPEAITTACDVFLKRLSLLTVRSVFCACFSGVGAVG